MSTRFQCLLVVGVLGFVAWASYSTGNYMAAQTSLREKERKIASASLENRRIESEFALLKRDLIKMMDTEEDKLGDYAKFVIEQYKNGDIEARDIDIAALGSEQHGAVFERIAFLEQRVEELKENHEQVLDAIRTTTKGRLKELEGIIKTTGLNATTLEKKLANLEDRKAVQRSKDKDDSPRGGPYNPLDEYSILQEQDEHLLHDLKRMTALSQVVEYLPLAKPMTHYKQTSGYGIRIDPFRKRPARHTGLDFSGPAGSKILATSDGVVKKTGRKGAYGLMVEVQHEFGLSTLYGHLSAIKVKPGQKVKRGDVMGIQGSTGRSTGAHLHYEVRHNGVTLNPAHFLKAGNDVRKIQN